MEATMFDIEEGELGWTVSVCDAFQVFHRTLGPFKTFGDALCMVIRSVYLADMYGGILTVVAGRDYDGVSMDYPNSILGSPGCLPGIDKETENRAREGVFVLADNIPMST
ncbi:MAG: hypothetical protein ABW078_15555 [Sedimenticola sp.]